MWCNVVVATQCSNIPPQIRSPWPAFRENVSNPKPAPHITLALVILTPPLALVILTPPLALVILAPPCIHRDGGSSQWRLSPNQAEVVTDTVTSDDGRQVRFQLIVRVALVCTTATIRVSLRGTRSPRLTTPRSSKLEMGSAEDWACVRGDSMVHDYSNLG